MCTDKMSDKVQNIVSAGIYWSRQSQRRKSINREKERELRSTEKDRLPWPPLQETDSPPIMLGGDVKTLYPSLDCVTSSEIAAQAVRETKIKFGGVNYPRLSD